jgi:hypothetical protein
MSTIFKNYGFTQTLVQDKNNKINNVIQWKGDYDGKVANIDIDINDNGRNEFVSMKLDNNDLKNLLNVHSVDDTLENRLTKDFLQNYNASINNSFKPMVLDTLISRRRKHRKSKRKNTRKHKHKHKKTVTHKKYT